MSEKYKLDKLDIGLIKLLQENSRMKNTEIAKKLNVTEGAIRKRISKLRAYDYIQRFTIELNEKVFGIRAVVEITIDGNVSPSIICDEISNKVSKGIEVIYETAGEVDLIVIFHSDSDNSLKNAIENVRAIKGVNSTKTHVVLKRTKVMQSFI